MAPVRVHVNAPGGEPLPLDLLNDAVTETLRAEGVEDAEISLTLLGDERMRELNRRYLEREYVPDVLSFALHDRQDPPLGDVYVGWEQAERQARAAAVTPTEELLRLAVHGTLHVLGHDHPEAPDERAGSEQYRRQEEIVRRLVDRHEVPRREGSASGEGPR